VRAGKVELDGFDVTELPPYRRVEIGRGGIAMVFQEPMSSLNPVLKIGEQIEEAVAVHEKLGAAARTRRARSFLKWSASQMRPCSFRPIRISCREGCASV
jgi:ABC-type microcin C transport system duplicated ATPase subunit YejF